MDNMISWVFLGLSLVAISQWFMEHSRVRTNHPIYQTCRMINKPFLRLWWLIFLPRKVEHVLWLWAFLIEVFSVALLVVMDTGLPWSQITHLGLWVILSGLLNLLRHLIYLVMVSVFVLSVLSWVSPYHRLMEPVEAVTRPFLQPLRRYLPTLGMIDFSPVVLVLLGQVLLSIPIGAMEMAVQRLL